MPKAPREIGDTNIKKSLSLPFRAYNLVGKEQEDVPEAMTGLPLSPSFDLIPVIWMNQQWGSC